MALWNLRKPLNQPPGFGRIERLSPPEPVVDASDKAALSAVRTSHYERGVAAQRVGGRRAFVAG